jgi:type I restriction enzyme S subunit
MSGETPRTLNDACEFIVDCLHATAPTEPDGYPLIRTPNIGKGRLDFTDVYRVSEETYQLWTRRAVPESNDLILAREAPAGNVAIVQDGEKVCLGQRTVHLRPDLKKVDPAFLCYFLLAPPQQGKLLAGETGATAKHVNMRDIRRLELSGLPSLQAQKMAGELLSAYDDLLENNRRRMALLEESARLLYREWFVRLRFPGYEHTQVVDGVPEGWNKGFVSDFYETSSGGTPSRKISEYFTGEIPWVKTQELPNAFITDTQEKITEQALKNSSAKLFPDRTVLVALYGATVGEIGILSMPATTNQACCAIIPLDERANFIHAFLFFRENKEKLVNLSAGAAQNNISQQIIRACEMIMPNSSLMNIFVESLAPVFDQWLNLQRQNEKLRAARDLLLPRLMSGEIAV